MAPTPCTYSVVSREKPSVAPTACTYTTVSLGTFFSMSAIPAISAIFLFRLFLPISQRPFCVVKNGISYFPLFLGFWTILFPEKNRLFPDGV